ncbi:MAG: RsmD family RNA methyltransferase [Candidatus Coatesbacteria bacterium]|nr:MAG: RsmD family RNA methyltransferase [Candidatus Coatesbacteria bacterium]
MSFKILGGELAGRNVETPDTLEVRPLGARVKRTVFDILGEAVVGARIADLFAGAGSFSFEALSRGAAEATMVEKNRTLVDYIYRNSRKLGTDDLIRVYEEDVREYLAHVRPERPYDIIFVDPPYRSGLVPGVLELIEGWPGAGAGSVVLTRVFKKEDISPGCCFVISDERAVGDDKITFFLKTPQ